MGDTMEVTKADLNEIYDQLRPMATDIAIIKTKLELMPQPEKRPCSYYDFLASTVAKHLAEHDTSMKDWKAVGMEFLSSAVKWIAVGAAAYFLAKGPTI